ncbi:hypothetical protein C5167_002784 [Papaver somniferum]|uniref:Uncharacterized protein n=1 Tax=Papaver somniferum TaxID=3469 RepID=A0A4Y7L1U2_PAPSO|nr:hypothetical protein C5167_002784 [Papaver somniferum]
MLAICVIVLNLFARFTKFQPRIFPISVLYVYATLILLSGDLLAAEKTE